MQAQAARVRAPAIPPLQNGDRLTAAEFERRYNAMPHLKKAELIDGVVYMAAALRTEQHGTPHAFLMSWLGMYWFATSGTRLSDNGTVRIDDDNVPQPDALLMIEATHGGQARIDSEGYVAGGPELVCEVAAERANIELHAKLQMYQQTKVREYMVWRVWDEAVDWFVLKGRRFQPLQPDAEGVIRSGVFSGLWLNVPALVVMDPQAMVATLQQGLASAEHRAFVERLARAKK